MFKDTCIPIASTIPKMDARDSLALSVSGNNSRKPFVSGRGTQKGA
jgi:hypothetical protein